MAIELYKHNKETYENIEEMFKMSDRVGIVQPTGTGKSYLFLKWIEENQTKKIILLAPACGILDQIVKDALMQNSYNIMRNVTRLTYQKLIRMSEEEINNFNANAIIVDEFHRIGASKWGDSVNYLLNTFPDAKVLGATATPIRYLDNARNMGTEIFNDNLARYMTLPDAIKDGILSCPRYVAVYYEEENERLILEEIEKIKDPVKKEEVLKKYKQCQKNIAKSAYTPKEIFKKYIPNKSGKFIVFCSSIDHMDEVEEKLREWFSDINYKINNIYRTISYDADKDINVECFDNDNNEGITLLLAIDRLNEGFHLNSEVDIMMLRRTESAITYFQQMGRAFSASRKSRPLILDFMNNYANVKVKVKKEDENNIECIINEDNIESSITDIEDIIDSENEDNIESSTTDIEDIIDSESKNESNKLSNIELEDDNIKSYTMINPLLANGFHIGENVTDYEKDIIRKINETLDIKNILSNQDWMEKFNLLKEFISEYGRLPKYNESYKGVNIGSWVNCQRQYNKDDKLSQNRIDLLESIGFVFINILDQKWMKNFNLLKEFISEYGRLPKYREIYKSKDIGRWCQKQRMGRDKLSQNRIDLLESIGLQLENKLEVQWMSNFNLLKEFISEYGRLPKNKETYKGVNIGSWLLCQRRYNKDDKLSQNRIDLLESIGFQFENNSTTQWMSNFNLLKEFISEYGRIPKNKETYKGVNIGSWYNHQKEKDTRNKLSQEKIKLLEYIESNSKTANEIRYKKQWMKKFNLLKEFISEYGRLPKEKETYQGVNIGSWYYKQKYNKGKLYEERINLLESIGVKFKD